jgi:hypothetical protein
MVESMLEQEKQNDPLTREKKSNSVGDFSRLNSKGTVRVERLKGRMSNHNQHIKDFSLNLKPAQVDAQGKDDISGEGTNSSYSQGHKHSSISHYNKGNPHKLGSKKGVSGSPSRKNTIPYKKASSLP